MTGGTAQDQTARRYRERLVPGPGIFIATLLLIPAVTLVLFAIEASIALPTGIVVYLITAVTLLLLSPTVSVEGGRLVAGRAAIPVSQLGRIELLGAAELRRAIGPGLDARSYLLVRGWIHRGVSIENIDPADPAPQWIITTRHPQKLAEAIEAARAEDRDAPGPA
ncbi:DUF3093 domain-containing protein [Leucobacter allii]|uniref:DUF3093 domain-containing protein n=1 Tax=Leucobacter allii TaxID=2932247 RepID=A0ABY4FQP8_9MICO|nr:DUF3093 domain-containing protein [Leucobacter allii]UOQ58616.1 DUF3093 domain-containing protein [Leucobacter allii]